MRFVTSSLIVPFREMRAKRFFQVAWLGGLFVVGLMFFAIWWQLFPEIESQIAVPLHYNVHFGVDLFGAWTRIFMIPIGGVVLLVFNVLASVVLWKKEYVLSYLFTSVLFVGELLLALGLVFVILLNLSYYG